jgi:sugar lactone lactonase YvrE
MTWDVMYASKVEALRGPSGRLLSYDPSTDQVTVLARGLWFANGVAVDKKEDYLLYAETFSLRVAKYHLTGDKQGTIEYIVDGDPSPACKSTGAIRYG